ncbi:MAG TPA: hypothetical protein VGQ13_01310, partial [Nitrososphaera sp.]|nr:hypothetical protein [Nitrososphaera sp.]
PDAKRLRIYFNNHYGAKAVANALEFKEMLGEGLTPEQENVKNRINSVLAASKGQKKMQEYSDTHSPSSAS